MAKTPKATLVSIEDVPPLEDDRPFDKMTPEEQRAAFVRKIMAQRAEDEKAKIPPPPPALTPRQKAQIEAEMARGREVLAKHQENLVAQRQAQADTPPDPREGSSVPVFRPEDYVPTFEQGKNASNSTRTSNL